jgi:hypothetical protein
MNYECNHCTCSSSLESGKPSHLKELLGTVLKLHVNLKIGGSTMSHIKSRRVSLGLLAIDLASQADAEGQQDEAEQLIEIALAIFDLAGQGAAQHATIPTCQPAVRESLLAFV